MRFRRGRGDSTVHRQSEEINVAREMRRLIVTKKKNMDLLLVLVTIASTNVTISLVVSAYNVAHQNELRRKLIESSTSQQHP